MHRFALTIAATFVAAASLTSFAQTSAQLSSDIIATYSEMLAKNPKSADLYLSRATEYLSRGLMLPAADDLRCALTLCDKNDKPLKFEILSRLADVEQRLYDNDNALIHLNEAVSLYPEVPSIIEQRASLLVAMGKLDDANTDYMRLKKLMPRSTAPFFGLARVAALKGDSNTALGYVNQAYGLQPNASASYIGHAEVLTLLGRNEEAINQYINAIATGDDNSGAAVQKLADLSDEDFPAVKAGFDRAIQKMPTAGMLYYFRANVSQAHNHFADALKDYAHINNSGPFAQGALNQPMADCLIALNRADEAKAILEAAPAKRHGNRWHNSMATAMLDLNMADSALIHIDKALALTPDMVEAMIVKSKILMSVNRKQEALAAITEAILTNPAIPEAYFIKASLSDDCESALMEVLELEYSLTDPSSLRGLALLALGHTDQAEGWIAGITLHGNDSDGEGSFITACYYARKGDAEKSQQYLDKAKAAGYDNFRAISRDNTPYISLTQD